MEFSHFEKAQQLVWRAQNREFVSVEQAKYAKQTLSRQRGVSGNQLMSFGELRIVSL